MMLLAAKEHQSFVSLIIGKQMMTIDETNTKVWNRIVFYSNFTEWEDYLVLLNVAVWGLDED